MPRQPLHSIIPAFALAVFFPALSLLAQSTPPSASAKTPPPVTAEKAMELGEQGRCKEAIPSLRRALNSSVNTPDFRKNAGVLGLRCALLTDDRDAATSFIQLMHKQFPQDPDILFIVVHAYSDLSTRTAQDLGRIAPGSIPAHKLMAEAFEMQGNWDQAQHEYEEMIKREPNLSGLHFLLGRSLLSQPNANPEAIERAKQEFQKELEIDPKNAGAHYILGELARKQDNCDEAIPHFSQATGLDPNFAEAYLSWGYCLASLKKYEEAIAQLRVAERLMPLNGSVHYALATALNFSGQKEEAQKEFAIHRKLVEAADSPRANEKPQ
jgi:tetratricopeptide (TPR) repeat protein